MKVSYQIIFVFAYIGYITCQGLNDIDVDDVKKKLGETIPEINGIDTSKFNASQLPSQEDVESTLREKCKKNGAENAVDILKEQQEKVKTCVESYVNFTLVQEELEEAKKTGSMDEVFGKYCKKWPSIYACFDNVTLTARSCMDKKEEAAFNKSLEIMEELQGFMCFKDGDRLAMFVAEGGIECIRNQKDGIEQCVNATAGARLPDADDFSTATLPTFLFTAQDCAYSEEESDISLETSSTLTDDVANGPEVTRPFICRDFDTIRTCVNKELEKCENTTPANIVDALFKFLRKHMPCGGAADPRADEVSKTAGNPSSAWSVKSLSVSSMIAIAFLLKTRLS